MPFICIKINFLLLSVSAPQIFKYILFYFSENLILDHLFIRTFAFENKHMNKFAHGDKVS